MPKRAPKRKTEMERITGVIKKMLAKRRLAGLIQIQINPQK